MQSVEELNYDNCGRLTLHPEFHHNHMKPYAQEELEYLCKYWEIDGPKTMGMALGRTEATVASKVTELKKNGKFEYYKNLNKFW